MKGKDIFYNYKQLKAAKFAKMPADFGLIYHNRNIEGARAIFNIKHSVFDATVLACTQYDLMPPLKSTISTLTPHIEQPKYE